MLHTTPGPQIFCTKNKCIFSREGAGNPSDQNLWPEATALREWPTDAFTPSMCKSLLQASTATVNKSNWEGKVVSFQMVEYADKEYSETKSFDIKCDNTKPAPKSMPISGAQAGAGSGVSLLTPPPRDIMMDNCVRHGDFSDNTGTSEQGPNHLVLCDETVIPHIPQ